MNCSTISQLKETKITGTFPSQSSSPLLSAISYEKIDVLTDKHLQELVTFFSSWLTKHPPLSEHDREFLAESTAVQLLSGQNKETSFQLKKLLNDNNKGDLPALLAIYILLSQEQSREAFEALNSRLPALTDEPEIQLIMGFLDVQHGALKSACTYCERVLKNHPEHQQALLLKSLIKFKSAELNEALANIKKLNSLVYNLEYLVLESRIHLHMEQPQLALSAIEKSHYLSNELTTDHLCYLAWLQLLCGNPNKALETLKESNRGGIALKLTGDILIMKGNYSEAILAYKEFLAEVPSDTTTRINLSQLLLISGQTNLAKQTLTPLFTEEHSPEKRAHELLYKIDGLLTLSSGFLPPD